MRRAVVWFVVVVVITATGGLTAAGWHFSNELLPAVAPSEPVYEIPVVEVDPVGGEVVLDATDGDVVDLTTVGLRTPTSQVLLHGPVYLLDGKARRTAIPLGGSWPEPGELAASSVTTFVGEPNSALGIPHRDVVVAGELGMLPAWEVVPPGSDTTGTWAVLVHGRGQERDEMNRVLPATYDLGLPSLAISIRNDPDAPQVDDGFNRFGHTEWADIDAAVDYLRDTHGAARFVLVGYSQGAGTVLTHLRRSDSADEVIAVVLVSPLVSMHATLADQAAQRDVPGPLVQPVVVATKLVSRLRAGIDFGALEHHEDAEVFATPMLVTHGTADAMIPVGPTRTLAERRPDLVTYVEYDGVGHVREWNADPTRFESDLRDFLTEHLDQAR